MTKNDDYTAVLLEDMKSQMDAILEITLDTRRYVKDLPTRNEFTELKDDVQVIKHAVTDTNKELKLFERHVTRLKKKIS